LEQALGSSLGEGLGAGGSKPGRSARVGGRQRLCSCLPLRPRFPGTPKRRRGSNAPRSRPGVACGAAEAVGSRRLGAALGSGKPSWQRLLPQLIPRRFEKRRGSARCHPVLPPCFQKPAVQRQSPGAARAGVIPAAGTAFPSAESLLKDLKPARSGYKAAPVLYCCFFIPATLGQEQGRFLRSPSEPRSPRMQHRESLPSPRGLGPRSEAGDAPSESVKMEKSIGRASDR